MTSKEQVASEGHVLCVYCGEPVEVRVTETVLAICCRCVKPDGGELFEAIYGNR